MLKNVKNFDKAISKKILNSDHNPVQLVLNDKVEGAEHVKVFYISKANWNNFRNYLNDNINLNFHIKTREEVENKVMQITKLINDAMTRNIPMKSNDSINLNFHLILLA